MSSHGSSVENVSMISLGRSGRSYCFCYSHAVSVSGKRTIQIVCLNFLSLLLTPLAC